MKRQLLIVSAALAALSIAACNQKQDAKTPADAAMPDANAAATVPTPADEAAAPDFAMKMADSDIFEIAAAKLAASRAMNSEVKAFAADMIKDHTKSSDDLKAAIGASGQAINLPTAVSADKQSKLDDLAEKKGADFDKAYMENQVDAHQAALDLLKRYAQDGDVEPLKAFATNTGAVVQQHYDHAKALRDSLK